VKKQTKQFSLTISQNYSPKMGFTYGIAGAALKHRKLGWAPRRKRRGIGHLGKRPSELDGNVSSNSTRRKVAGNGEVVVGERLGVGGNGFDGVGFGELGGGGASGVARHFLREVFLIVW